MVFSPLGFHVHQGHHCFTVPFSRLEFILSVPQGAEYSGQLIITLFSRGNCTVDLDNCNVIQDTIVQQYGDDFVTQLTSIATWNKPGNGAFIHSCYTHCDSVIAVSYLVDMCRTKRGFLISFAVELVGAYHYKWNI